MAKEYFTTNAIPFTEYNVAEDDAKRDEMFEKSQQMGVPVIQIGEKILVGFNQPDVEAALSQSETDK